MWVLLKYDATAKTKKKKKKIKKKKKKINKINVKKIAIWNKEHTTAWD